MNDKKFLDLNRTGIIKRLSGNALIIPKEIRENNNLESGSLVEIIPMNEGVYIRKAVGQKEEN